MEFIGKTNIDFMGLKKISFTISAIVVLLGLFAIVQMFRGEANMGIDFAGGTEIQLKFVNPVTMDSAREILAKHGLKEATLQDIRDGNQLLIKIGKTTLATGKVADTVESIFQQELPNNKFTVESSTEIGPSVGDKLRKDTITAIIISLIGIIIYIAWRFDFRFGVGATLATLHDVFAMFAFFYLTGKEMNLLFITAVLTIAGYSLTDTVVVFDRIRENMRKNVKEHMNVVFNRSINEVLSRTIVTSFTVFLAALSLFIFGGEVIHDFAFALLIGVIAGTYSSIFVASPIVSIWEEKHLKIED
ncbi:MAG: protein translocase subunit SecF [Desulfuromonadales bacterium]|nr:protein translocase subunit SecF [Desulfuromonadales bacterium]